MGIYFTLLRETKCCKALCSLSAQLKALGSMRLLTAIFVVAVANVVFAHAETSVSIPYEEEGAQSPSSQLIEIIGGMENLDDPDGMILMPAEGPYKLRPSDGKFYKDGYSLKTNKCKGKKECQFKTLKAAEKFCNLQLDCQGVVWFPPASKCGKRCFVPRRGAQVFSNKFRKSGGK